MCVVMIKTPIYYLWILCKLSGKGEAGGVFEPDPGDAAGIAELATKYMRGQGPHPQTYGG